MRRHTPPSGSQDDTQAGFAPAQVPRSSATTTAFAACTAARTCCLTTSWPVVCPCPRRCALVSASGLVPPTSIIAALFSWCAHSWLLKHRVFTHRCRLSAVSHKTFVINLNPSAESVAGIASIARCPVAVRSSCHTMLRVALSAFALICVCQHASEPHRKSACCRWSLCTTTCAPRRSSTPRRSTCLLQTSHSRYTIIQVSLHCGAICAPCAVTLCSLHIKHQTHRLCLRPARRHFR